MKIKVKILNGQETELEVSETEPVLSVKALVSREMNVEVDDQRLVYRGKTLTDNCCLHDYEVTDGAKLHLFVKKSSEVSELRAKCSKTDFWLNLRTLLKSHFSDADAEKVLQKSREDFNSWMAQLSLDDIERMAQVHMEEQSPGI
ncbi:ubiquitin-like protein 4A [Actinia tenebrosa]|uniref:Ubiquitin-like protein 4A n=1 Tax=Actinia tenebrosa TaxID=6105 RepID=A0A6P8HZY1_ACTTE|nr:ubiquitin-like protein 4A [Actinia tenebrosa]